MVQWNKLGKSCNDLFKKKYDFSNSISTKNTSGDVTVEAQATRGNALVGKTTMTVKNSKYGELEVALRTDAKDDNAAGKLTLNKLSDGLEVTIKGSKKAVNVDTVLNKGNVTVTAGFSSASKANAAVVLSNDGLSVGGAVALDINSGEVSDYNVGTQWTSGDVTTTLVTSNKGEDITASYCQKVNGALIGAKFTLQPENNSRSLTIGTQWNLDDKTLVKAKLESSGVVSTVVEHRLASPSCLLGVSTSWNALAAGSDILKAQACGVQLKFGDQ